MRKRRRCKGVMVDRQARQVPTGPNEIWSIDFVMDALANGRRTKCLTIVGDFTPVNAWIRCRLWHLRWLRSSRSGGDRSIPRSATGHSHRPGARIHQPGPRPLAYGRGVDLKLIAAGKPTQNAYIESFNGKFRDECLNDHYFNNLAHARAVIADWRRDYNETRPHSAIIGRMPPAEFAARHRLRSDHGTELTIV